MAKPTLYLMVGYPGSGKTTTAKIIQELTGATHLWVDSERKQRFAHPTHSHQENDELYGELNAATDQLLAEGKSVIYDTSFNFYDDRERLRAIAAKHGAQTYVIWLVAPKDIARGRATKNADAQETRVLGDMSDQEFERIAAHLQEPRDNEQVIRLEGQGLTSEIVARSLAKNGLVREA